MFFSHADLKFIILFNSLRARVRWNQLALSLLDIVWYDWCWISAAHSPLNYGVKVILNHHNHFVWHEYQLIHGGGGIHISENQNETSEINNLRGSYRPHLFSFSTVCFHLWLTVILDHVGFKVLMVHNYSEVG